MTIELKVSEYLSSINDPNSGTTLLETANIKSLEINDSSLKLTLILPYAADLFSRGLKTLLQVGLQNIAGDRNIDLSVICDVASSNLTDRPEAIQSVKHIIAVASGKGGVGKSTTAVNVALALSREGAKVGILDADIYGPSQAMMLGVAQGQRPETKDEKWMFPIEAHGIKSMSMAYLIDEQQPMVWRGPMVSTALQQMMFQTQWGELDYLIVDMPPGTGDIQLTFSQKVPASGALIVTTPQDIALLDAVKGIEMFRKVNIPVLGIVENMSMHVCSNCGHEEAIFGENGGAKIADQFQTRMLGNMPLDLDIRKQLDGGQPSVIADPESLIAARYQQIALGLAAEIASSLKQKVTVPDIQITED